MRPDDFELTPFHDRSEVRVRATHLDFMGHVNNAQFLTWAQEATLTFWREHAPIDAVARMAWVAVEHCIRYRKPLFLDDIVEVEIAVQNVRGPNAHFITRFLRGGHEVATMESIWCCICASRHRPLRVPNEIIAKFVAPGTGSSADCPIVRKAMCNAATI